MEPLIAAVAIFAAVLGFAAQPEPQLEPEMTEVIQTPTTWKLEDFFKASGCHEGFALVSQLEPEDGLSRVALEGMREINQGQFGPAEETCTAVVFSRKVGQQKSYAVAILDTKFEEALHKGAHYIIRTKGDDIVIAEK